MLSIIYPNVIGQQTQQQRKSRTFVKDGKIFYELFVGKGLVGGSSNLYKSAFLTLPRKRCG
jgi:hypothetical protein